MTPPEDLNTRETLLILVHEVRAIKKDAAKGVEQNLAILKAQEDHRLQAALNNQRLDGVEERVQVMESDKRSLGAMIAAGAAVIGSVGTLLWDMLSGKHP